MLLEVLALAGMATITAGYVALVRNIRDLRTESPQIPLHAFIAAAFAGAGLAVVVVLLPYPYSADERVLGFPFAAAFLSREITGGQAEIVMDSNFRAPMQLANAVWATLLAQLVLYIRYGRTRPGLVPHRPASPRRMMGWRELVLLVTTILITLVYVPLVIFLHRVWSFDLPYSSPVDVMHMNLMVVVPPAAEAAALCLALVSLLRRGLTKRGRAAWALLVAAAVLGLPFTLMMAFAALLGSGFYLAH